jgi:hypothetical protein
MLVKDIVALLQGEVLSGESKLNEDVESIGASDMMSDILALSKPNMLVLTGHTTPQAVRTGMVTQLLGLVIVRGKQLPPQTLNMAKANDFLLIRTEFGMYSTAGKLYEGGLRGGDEQ